MASSKLSSVSNSRVVFGLIALTIVYQIAYHVIVKHAFDNSDASDDECDNPLTASSPVCLEAQLFRSWKQAESEERAVLIGGNVGSSVDTFTDTVMETLPTPAPTSFMTAEAIIGSVSEDSEVARSLQDHLQWQHDFDALYNDTLSSIRDRSGPSSWAQHVQSLQDSLEKQKEQLPSARLERARTRALNFDKVYNDTLAAIHDGSNSTWAKDLLAMQAYFDAWNEKLPSTQKKHREERAALFDKLYNDTMASIENTSSVSAWAKDLEALQEELENKHAQLLNRRKARMQKHRERFDELYNTTMESIWSGNASLTPWSKDLMALQKSFEDRMSKLKSEHAKTSTASQQAPTVSTKPRDDSLLEEIQQFGRELCNVPKRRNRPVCKQFLSENSKPDTRQAEETNQQVHAIDRQLSQMEKEHAEWEESFTDAVNRYGRELCADPSRANYAACAQFLSDGNLTAKPMTIPSKASPSLRGDSNILRWSLVDASVKHPRGKKGEEVVMGRSLLRHAKWHGKTPKVACITMVPAELANQYSLRYFIDNFIQQNYEGDTELVLVYNYLDSEVGKLVKDAAAQKKNIKAVAARNGGVFPSTGAYRYGAWRADADVIARWNFDEWHHPERLSMQVRAMAAASRPVSMLKGWTVLGNWSSLGSSLATEKPQRVVSSASGWRGSIVGHVKWMREHWMPLLEEEQSILENVQSHYLVKVDMPELTVFDAGSYQTWQDVLRHFDILRPAQSTGMDVCLAIEKSSKDKSATTTATTLAAKIEDLLGADMSSTFKDLAVKQDDVARRLRTLCTEAAAEHDTEHKQQLLQGVEQVAKYQQQLKDRFGALENIFDHHGK